MTESAHETREEDEEAEPGPHRRTEERSCSQCGIKLSLYNPNPTCWRHTMGNPWRGPTARPRF